MPGETLPSRQRQVYIPGGGNTFIVTCTGEADRFDGYVPTFDSILASFKVPPPRAACRFLGTLDDGCRHCGRFRSEGAHQEDQLVEV